MPLWLRKFTYAKIKDHYDKQSEIMKKRTSNPNKTDIIGKDGKINIPTSMQKANKK